MQKASLRAPGACAGLAANEEWWTTLTSPQDAAGAVLLHIAPGKALSVPDDATIGWQIVRGAFQIERADAGGATVTQVAGPGDWLVPPVGDDASEQWVALLPSTVRVRAMGEPRERARWLSRLVQQQRRQALDMARLRTGPAAQRLRHLLGLLANGCGQGRDTIERKALPPLRELARIVDVAPETVCRELARLAWPASPARGAAARA